MEFLIFVLLYVVAGHFGGVKYSRHWANERVRDYNRAKMSVGSAQKNLDELLSDHNGYYIPQYYYDTLNKSNQDLKIKSKRLSSSLVPAYLIGVLFWWVMLLIFLIRGSIRGVSVGSSFASRHLTRFLSKGTDLAEVTGEIRRRELEKDNAKLETELNIKDPLKELDDFAAYDIWKGMIINAQPNEIQLNCKHEDLIRLPSSLRSLYGYDKFCTKRGCGKLV